MTNAPGPLHIQSDSTNPNLTDLAPAAPTPVPDTTITMAKEPTPTSTAPAAHTPAAESTASMNPVRPGGAPARVYMNEKIVPYLLEGMKNVTKEQPPNPLRVLGEFLIQKSNEVESGQSGKAPE